MNYTKNDVIRLNYTTKYGSGWITNASQLNSQDQYNLYPTGDCTLSGRKYIALSKPPTEEDKKTYNLI